MENQVIIKEALHEFCHRIDEGSDYEQSLEFVANYFIISKEVLEQAYNDFVMAL